MSKHHATIRWQRQPIRDGYSRNHVWGLGEGLEIPASASPSVVPPPYSQAGRMDPEAAFVGSVASCHMLWFLSLAHERGYIANGYVDEAVGILARDDAGRMSIARIELNPLTRFEGRQPSSEQLGDLHGEAHERCFIANSVKSAITVHPALETQGV